MKKFLLVFVAAILFSSLNPSSAAAEAPLQVAIINPVQLVEDFDNVKGLRLNIIYGVNYNVSGLDLGLINKVDGTQKGIQVGLINNTFASSGIQIGLINRTEWLTGLQIGLVNIHKEGKQKFLPIINYHF